MHKIQKFILAQLMEQSALRYSDMRPLSMEASQFMYHLKKLLNESYVTKTPDGKYSLSSKGRQFVDRADTDQIVLRDQPRVAALIVCTNADGEVLLMRRATQPFVDWLGFPIVDIPIDFPLPLAEHVSSGFTTITGLEGTLKHRADGYIKLCRNGELEGNLMTHLVAITADDAKKLTSHDGNDYFWARPNDTEHVLPSVHYVIEQLQSHSDFFFFEYEHNIEEKS